MKICLDILSYIYIYIYIYIIKSNSKICEFFHKMMKYSRNNSKLRSKKIFRPYPMPV